MTLPHLLSCIFFSLQFYTTREAPLQSGSLSQLPAHLHPREIALNRHFEKNNDRSKPIRIVVVMSGNKERAWLDSLRGGFQKEKSPVRYNQSMNWLPDSAARLKSPFHKSVKLSVSMNDGRFQYNEGWIHFTDTQKQISCISMFIRSAHSPTDIIATEGNKLNTETEVPVSEHWQLLSIQILTHEILLTFLSETTPSIGMIQTENTTSVSIWPLVMNPENSRHEKGSVLSMIHQLDPELVLLPIEITEIPYSRNTIASITGRYRTVLYSNNTKCEVYNKLPQITCDQKGIAELNHMLMK